MVRQAEMLGSFYREPQRDTIVPLNKWAERKARSIHHLSVENHRWMREWIETHNSTCEYRQGGSLQLASSPEEEQELIESADLLLEDGFEAELLYGDELGEPYVSAGFQTGIVLPEDGEIHPAKFVQHVIQQAPISLVYKYIRIALYANRLIRRCTSTDKVWQFTGTHGSTLHKCLFAPVNAGLSGDRTSCSRTDAVYDTSTTDI